MLELLEMLADALASNNLELEALEGQILKKSGKNSIKSQLRKGMRKYHYARSIWAKTTNPVGYQLQKAKLNLLKNHAQRYLDLKKKFNPNIQKLITNKLNSMVNDKIFSAQKNELKELRRLRNNLKRKIERLEKKYQDNKDRFSNSESLEYIKDKREVMDLSKKVNDTTKRIRNNNNRKIFIQGRRRRLSSSFLDMGLFVLKDKDRKIGEWEDPLKNYGDLTLWIKGKAYFYTNFPQVYWISMFEAFGRNGTGAGSVLWNTFWYHKRSKSIYLPPVYRKSLKDIKNKAKVIKSLPQPARGQVENFYKIQLRRATTKRMSKYYLKRMAYSSSNSIIYVRSRKKRKKNGRR